MELSNRDMQLMQSASDFITKNYKKGRHHVACALRNGNKDYFSLHLDTKGFDVCAEPIAISNALIEGHGQFESIVSVIMGQSGDVKVIAPCGNCRQILYEYAPNVSVIVPDGESYKKVNAKSLLPYPYE